MQAIAAILFVKGVMVGSIYALISLGFNVIYQTTGMLNFAQGEFVMLGGVIVGWAYATGSVPLVPSLLLGVGGAAVAGWLVDALAIRAMRRARLVIPLIITVGVAIFLISFAALIWGTEPMPLPSLVRGDTKILGAPVESPNLCILATAALCMAGLTLFFRCTFTDMAMRACSENPGAARLCGVNPGRMSAYSFALSGLLVGVGGLGTSSCGRCGMWSVVGDSVAIQYLVSLRLQGDSGLCCRGGRVAGAALWIVGKMR
jgi:branched-chain amino acid transport system permease protein